MTDRRIGRYAVLFFIVLFAGLTAGGCREAYDSASCEKGCASDFNRCLTTAVFYSRTPGQQSGPVVLLTLACLTDQDACKNTCNGFQSRE